MPTLMAVILAMVASLLVEAAVKPYLGVPLKAAVTLAVFFGVAYAARRQLLRLRDGGE